MRLLTLPIACGLAIALTGCAAITSYKTTTYDKYVTPSPNEVTTRSIGEQLIESGRGALEPTIVVHEEKKFIYGTVPVGRYQYDTDTKDEIWFQSGNYKTYFYVEKSSGRVCFASEDCASVKHTISRIRTSTTKDSFQQTLLFNGKIGNRVILAYREFQDGYARPAFSNTVEFDITESKIVGYKGARIEVINATGTEMTYRVLTGFQ